LRARRTDSNQELIVASLRERGATVIVLSSLGTVWDLAVSWQGFKFWADCKVKTRLTQKQKEFREIAPGPFLIIRNIEDIDNIEKMING
jgi:hypothetical protein